jgi:hypothetical protein
MGSNMMIRVNRPNQVACRRVFFLIACLLCSLIVAGSLFPVGAIAQSPPVTIATSELSLNKVDQVIEVTSSMISGLPVQADFLLLNNTGTTFRQLKVEKSCGCVSLRLPDMDFESKGTLPVTLSYRPKGEDFSQVIELSGVAEGANAITRFARVHIVGKCEPPFVLHPTRFIMDPSVAGERIVNLRGKEGVVLESISFQASDSEVSCIKESDEALRIRWNAMPSASGFSVDVKFDFRAQDLSNGVYEQQLQFAKPVPISVAPSMVRMRVRDEALTGIVVLTDQDSNGKGYEARFAPGEEKGQWEKPKISLKTETLSPGKFLCLLSIEDFESVSEGFESEKVLLSRVGESEAIVDFGVSFRPK